MNALVIITASLLIISKFLDCISTSSRISGFALERNPIARLTMKTIGVKQAIWLFFFIAVIIIIISFVIVFYYYTETIFKISFIAIGLTISSIQFYVAFNNYKKFDKL